MDYTKPKRRSLAPPSSPYTDSPRPLPLPSKKSAFELWEASRSKSLNIIVSPAKPTAVRSVSNPNVAIRPIGSDSNEFESYDWYSSAEPAPDSDGESDVGAKVNVEADLPNRYAISYYNIIGLPESPDVTARDVHRAYFTIRKNPPPDLPYDQATLKRIHNVLTNPFRRSIYDQGRRFHLRDEKERKNQEKRLKEHADAIDRIASAKRAEILAGHLRTEHLKEQMEGLKMQFEESVKIKSIGTQVGMRISLADMDDEEGVLYEEEFKEVEPTGERMSFDFEYAGSGSESEGSEEEEGSGGTFSEREEETEEPASNEGIEEPEVSAVVQPAPEIFPSIMETGSNLEEESEAGEDEELSPYPSPLPEPILNLKEEPEENIALPLSISPPCAHSPETPSNLDKKFAQMSAITESTDKYLDLTNIETIIDLLFPDATATEEIIFHPLLISSIPSSVPALPSSKPNENFSHPDTKPEVMRTEDQYLDLTNIETIIDLLFPNSTSETNPTAEPKTPKKPHKEIWEADYNSESDTDTDSEADTETATEDTHPSPLTPRSKPPSRNITTLSLVPPQSTPFSPFPSTPNTPLEIWQPDFASEVEIQDTHETQWLSTTLTISTMIASLAWVWFGQV